MTNNILRLSILFSAIVIYGCQSTQQRIDQPIDPMENLIVELPVDEEQQLNDIDIPPVVLQDERVAETLTPPNFVKPNVKSKNKSFNEFEQSLLQRLVCRNNVEVKYSVTDKYGITGSYHAKVQAQGVIVGVSEDNELIKIQIIGWYTRNQNLQQWQPYLEKAPLTKDFPLATNKVFWAKKYDWFLCGSATQST